MQKLSNYLAAVAILVALAGLSLASIENEPVKVTHQNAGPIYDVGGENEVERTRLSGPPEPDAEPRGHLTIRRIFLIPYHTPSSSMGESGEPQDSVEQPPNPFAGLLQPPHAFFPWRRPSYRAPAPGEDGGAAEKPLPPPMMAAGEREESQERPQMQPGVDPFQLMLSILRQTLQAAAAEHQQEASGNKQPADLDKDQSAIPNPLSGELDKANKVNETKEDVVDIDGKKYLRKMVVTKHLGDNMFFVTRRLVFTPLNETISKDGSPTQITTERSQTTTVLPTTETPLDEKSEQPIPPSSPSSISSTPSTTTVTTPEAPTTSLADVISSTTSTKLADQNESSSSPAEEYTTTPAKFSVETMSPVTTSV